MHLRIFSMFFLFCIIGSQAADPVKPYDFKQDLFNILFDKENGRILLPHLDSQGAMVASLVSKLPNISIEAHRSESVARFEEQYPIKKDKSFKVLGKGKLKRTVYANNVKIDKSGNWGASTLENGDTVEFKLAHRNCAVIKPQRLSEVKGDTKFVRGIATADRKYAVTAHRGGKHKDDLTIKVEDYAGKEYFAHAFSRSKYFPNPKDYAYEETKDEHGMHAINPKFKLDRTSAGIQATVIKNRDARLFIDKLLGKIELKKEADGSYGIYLNNKKQIDDKAKEDKCNIS